MSDPITKRIGHWKVELKEIPHIALRWRCTVSDDFEQRTFAEAVDAESAVRRAASLVGADYESWLKEFGLWP